MRTADVDCITFGLRLDAASKVTSLYSDQVSGTTGWKKYEITFDVPVDAQGFAVAPGNLGSRGRFWLAEVHLDIVDGQAPTVGKSQQFHYAGNTPRVVHTWMLSRKGEEVEALAEARAIAADPTASKEERCTATEGVAYSLWTAGNTEAARKAIDDFEAQAKDLNIDPGVVAEARRTREHLNEAANAPAPSAPQTTSTPTPPATPEATVETDRWHNANGNDWTGASTSPHNLNFAAGLSGWEKGADYSSAPDYVAGFRGRGGYRGAAYAILESRVKSPRGNAVLCQWVRADNYLGRRVRITATLRLRSPHATRGSLFAHLDTRGSYSFWDGLPGLAATSGWRRCSLVIDVPADGQGFILGGSLIGRGTLEIADVHVNVVDRLVPLTSGGVTR
jgi:hypothetical protein